MRYFSMYREHHKQTCKFCGRQIDVANIVRHEKSCQIKKSSDYIDNKVHINHDGLNCQYCNKLCKNLSSLAQHEIRCSQNPNRKDFDKLMSYAGILKGKTKDNCESLKRASEKLKEAYASGKIKAHSWNNVATESDYYHYEHNLSEINKWLKYIANSNFQIPDYKTLSHNEDYVIIAGWNRKSENSNTIQIKFEHDYLANILLNNCLQKENTVHHRNKVRDDNHVENLIVFVNDEAHKRYHTSKYAYLIYNEETHLFDCIIKKDISTDSNQC